MTCGIYCIENTVNNKKYIGQSRHIEKRIAGHFIKLASNKHSNRHLNDSYNIYGKHNFNSFVVTECPENLLDELEIYYISKYETTDRNHGYNMMNGGGGTKGRTVTIETRKKISAINKGRIFSKERNEKISKAKKGIPKYINKEWRDKLTYATTGEKTKSATTSLYRGVSYCQRDNCWRVYLKGKAYGSFKKEIVAALHFDKISWEILKDPSKLNFPEKYISINPARQTGGKRWRKT